MGNTGSKTSGDLPPLYSSMMTRDYLSINSAQNINSHQMASLHDDDLRIGTSLAGQMSAVRRFFCLLTTFDLLFTLLLWLICTVLNGHKINVAFCQEVLQYDIHESLFDIVMLSCWRFITLLATYALFRMSHWWPVAITTAGSGAFIIAKVFLYDSQHLSHASAIVLLLSSFIISWGEAWFFDFKVVPSELNARVLLARHINECTPRIPGNIHYAPSEGASTCFFSTPGSDKASDSENEEDKQIAIDMEEPLVTDLPRKYLTTEEIIQKKRIDEGLEKSLSILTSESWKTSKVVGEDVVQSQILPKYGKVFKFVGVINAPVSALAEELFFKLDSMHQWNPTVKCTKVIQKIDSHTDVYYVIASGGAGGLVSSRDFINVRTWQKKDTTFVCASVATQHPDVPLHSKYIRGEQGPSIYVLSPVQDDPNKCHVQWLLNTDLKGWLPQYLIDQSLAGNMLECIYHTRRHMAEIAPQRV